MISKAKSLFLVLMSLLITNISYAKSQDYSIVIVPDQICSKKLETLNSKLAQMFSGSDNPTNIYHITLFHGNYDQSDLATIKENIQTINESKFNVSILSPILNIENRWFEANVRSSDNIQNLHRKIVEILNQYRKGPVQKMKDQYAQLPTQKQKLVDQYGMKEVLDSYRPHITMFYHYPVTHKIDNKSLESLLQEDFICGVEKIAIGEIGYNGNVIKLAEEIKLN